MKLEVATLTSKGQLTVPIAIRTKLNLQAGDKVIFVMEDDDIRITNVASLALHKEGEGAVEEKKLHGKATEAKVRSASDYLHL